MNCNVSRIIIKYVFRQPKHSSQRKLETHITGECEHLPPSKASVYLLNFIVHPKHYVDLLLINNYEITLVIIWGERKL